MLFSKNQCGNPVEKPLPENIIWLFCVDIKMQYAEINGD